MLSGILFKHLVESWINIKLTLYISGVFIYHVWAYMINDRYSDFYYTKLLLCLYYPLPKWICFIENTSIRIYFEWSI